LSWTSKTLTPALLALALVGSGSALAETIVVKSVGPSAKAYPPGKSLPDNSRVTLGKLDVLTILDGRGTRVFKGPGIFSTTASTTTNSAIGSMLRNTGTRQVRTGAVRTVGASAVARPPSVWLIDATKSGTVCVAGTEAVSIWMPSKEAASSITITRISDGKSVPVAFRPMLSTRAWPSAELPISNNGQFKVSGDGLPVPVSLRFVLLGLNPQGIESTASALIKSGCNAQLDLLVEAVAVPAVEEGPSG
jgi:hypothetical protein